MLEPDIIGVVEVIDSNNGMAIGKKGRTDPRPDEAGDPGQ
jgi:hypothetical protein